MREYVEILREWQLTDAQWTKLRREAKLRFDFFPRISQLTDLMRELTAYSNPPGQEPLYEIVTDEHGHSFARRRDGGPKPAA